MGAEADFGMHIPYTEIDTTRQAEEVGYTCRQQVHWGGVLYDCIGNWDGSAKAKEEQEEGWGWVGEWVRGLKDQVGAAQQEQECH